MEIIDSLRNYFLVDLPNSINTIVAFFIDSVGAIIWIIFLIFIILSGLFISNLLKNRIKESNLKIKLDELLNDITDLSSTTDIEEILFKSLVGTFRCKFNAIYELRGQTYILISTNSTISQENQRTNIPLRLPVADVKRFISSGNFTVNKVFSSSKNILLIAYSNKENEFTKYNNIFKLILGYYELLISNVKESDDKKMAKITEETMQAIVKVQFGKDGYLKFLISIILKIFNAKGGMIASHDGSEKYIVGDVEGVLQKEFFIRNTPYKFNFYSDENLVLESIKEIGSFLDLSGSFLVSLEHQSSVIQNYITFLKNANKIMESTNQYYKNHSEKVKIVALEVAKNLFVDQSSLDGIELAAELHDIGMVGNMEVILNNNKELNEKDIDLMHYHPVIGSILLEPIAHLYPITTIVKQHHERYDGKGYPNKLKGAQISLEAQALSLAEYYVGLISDRSYKKGMDLSKAEDEIKSVSGKIFDQTVVEAFNEAAKTIRKKLTRLNEAENNE